MNRNADATREFLEDAVPIVKTRDERILAARLQIEGCQKLAKSLIEQGQRAVAEGNANAAILFRNEAEAVMKVVKVNQTLLEGFEAEQLGVDLRKRFPNFFERREIHQTAVALHKTDEIVLADKANLAVQSKADRRAWKGQKINRNIAPAAQGVGDLLGMGDGGNSLAAKSMCARHCQKEGKDVQGRSNCTYCNGAGFNAALKIREGKDAK
jgi:hypothetical protein